MSQETLKNKFRFWYSKTHPLSGRVFEYLKEQEKLHKLNIEFVDANESREKTRTSGVRFVPTIQVLNENNLVISEFRSFNFNKILNLEDFSDLDEFIKNQQNDNRNP